MILEHAGMHTKFMCGRLGTVDKIDSMTARAVWHDAFKSSWLGNHSLLPPVSGPNKTFGLTNEDLVLVKSRALYEHLANFLPNMSESNPAYATIDTQMNNSFKSRGEYVVPFEVRRDDKKYCSRLLNIAMRHMWLDLLEDKIKQLPYAVARNCIWNDHVDLLRHLLTNNIVRIDHLKRYIFTGYDVEAIYYWTMDYAAWRGQLDILKLLHEFGCTDISTKAMNLAAENGHLHVVKWLHENRTEGCTTHAMDLAAENGHLHVVKWLHENRTEGCTTDAIDSAALRGHLHVIKWLHENRSEGCTSKAIDNAAKNGHTEIVRFLLHNNFAYTKEVISKSIANGHRDIANMLIRPRNSNLCRIV